MSSIKFVITLAAIISFAQTGIAQTKPITSINAPAPTGKTSTDQQKDSASEGPLIVNIDNPNFRRLVMAIPTFFSSNLSSANVMLKDGPVELGRLLQFSGLFNIMSEVAYADALKTLPPQLEKQLAQEGTAGIDVMQWRALAVESVTFGALAENGGKYELTLKTIDINRGTQIVGRKFSGIVPQEFNLVLRRYADLILEAYTGKTGIFQSKIVFVGKRSKRDEKQIYVCDFDGSNVVQITKDKTVHLSPAWSPDGKYITFTSYRDKNPDLYRYEVATGNIKKLSGYDGINSGSHWSKDGKWIAYSGAAGGNVNIYLLNPEGGARQTFIEGNGLDVDPAFSPDGQYMAFVSGRFGNPHIFRAQLVWNGNRPQVIGDKRLTYAGWYNATPAWSPDGERLAFAGYDKDINRFDLFIMNSDGSNMERLTLRVGDNERPSFSPNGQMIAFHSNRVGTADRKGPAQIFVMNRDGGSQRALPTGLYEAQTPQWSSQLGQ